MTRHRSPKLLSKLLFYILGRKPYEFGLVLNQDGFAKIKDVLKAVCEENGFAYVRRSHIDEILVTLPTPIIEIEDDHIRATHRESLPNHTRAQNIPKLLYTCIRRKAHLSVAENGIFPTSYNKVILSSERSMAERMGKRADQMPVLLTVQTRKAIDEGIVFYTAGGTLYLTESIHPGCFTGPPLPKAKPVSATKEAAEDRGTWKFPGSFLLEMQDKKGQKSVPGQPSKTKSAFWKKDKKRLRKQKLKRERPHWRK